MHVLALALILSQTYEWTDSSGALHFTDDKSSIPKGVKFRVTEGAELTEMGAVDPLPTSKPDSQGKKSKDTCAIAKAALEKAEARLKAANVKVELATLRARGDCEGVRAKFGDAEATRCQRPGRRAATAPPSAEPEAKAVDQAREQLRKAQVSGCSE